MNLIANIKTYINLLSYRFLVLFLVLIYGFISVMAVYVYGSGDRSSIVIYIILGLLFVSFIYLLLMKNKEIVSYINDNEYLLYIPILLILFAEFLKPYATNNYIEIIKLISIAQIVAIGLLYYKSIPKYYLLLLIVILLWMFFNSINTYSIRAVFEDGIRYLFPFFITIFGAAFRFKLEKLLKYLVGFVVINDIVQILIFIIYFIDVDSYMNLGFHYRNNQVYGIIRPSGLTHAFDFFAFSNFIAYYLVGKFDLFKHKKYLKLLFLIFIFASLVYKYIALVFLYFIIEKKWKPIIVLTFFMISVFFFNKNIFSSIYNGARDRINLYLVDGNSMRTESLKFTYDYLLHNNPFKGEGVGTFGGPASTKYLSPFYKKNNLNWFEYYNATTIDNYHPHLFVENGLFLGFLYLFTVFSIFIVYFKKMKKYWFLLLTTLFISFFNFSINTLVFQFYFFILLLPFLTFNQVINDKKLKKIIYN